MAAPDIKSRFTGTLLGTFIGDALGMPFEGQTHHEIAVQWNADYPMLDARLGKGTYTDDTQMTIALAESLTHCGKFNGRDAAQRFLTNYQPDRGYGMGTRSVLQTLKIGTPWDQAASVIYPEGSFGNGAAMRVAPVGLFYRNDPQQLRQAAENSAAITHTHPLGKEGAAVQAMAVALAANSDPDNFDPPRFIQQLTDFAREDRFPFPEQIAALAKLLKEDPALDEVADRLGNDVRAHHSVPTAIYMFLSRPWSFKEAVAHAVLLGGDTDTIAAMTGAIAGAFLGIESIPTEWMNELENDEKGRDYVTNLSEKLYNKHQQITLT
jgi:ADP-ribosylglycohydrolase